METLPVELWQSVCDHLDMVDVLNFRSVSCFARSCFDCAYLAKRLKKKAAVLEKSAELENCVYDRVGIELDVMSLRVTILRMDIQADIERILSTINPKHERKFGCR